jgi:hypothetical protein
MDPTKSAANVYFYNLPSQVHVASANTVHWDLFNADSALIVRVLSVKQIPDIVTAVTGVAFAWTFDRTTAVGTGGSAQTAILPDLSQSALSANITCRSKPTAGATAGVTLASYSIHSEETNTGTLQIAAMGGYELVRPSATPDGLNPCGILLRTNQGLRCVQVTNSAAGNTGWLITFAVETWRF